MKKNGIVFSTAGCLGRYIYVYDHHQGTAGGHVMHLYLLSGHVLKWIDGLPLLWFGHRMNGLVNK